MEALGTLLEIVGVLVDVAGGIALAVTGLAVVRRLSSRGGVLVAIAGLTTILNDLCLEGFARFRSAMPDALTPDTARLTSLVLSLALTLPYYLLLLAAAVAIGADLARQSGPVPRV